MLDQRERTILKAVALISAVLLFAVAILIVVTHSSNKAVYEFLEQIPAEQPRRENLPPEPPAKSNAKPVTTEIKLADKPRVYLRDIIPAATNWAPVISAWCGETAPDFILVDINGKEHKLSDYLGKNVLIIIWTTWSKPCVTIVPNFIALRNLIGEDKLAMLAISDESLEAIKKFVDEQKINYTVSSHMVRAMPAPYSKIEGLPTMFFIDPEGKIKLIAGGIPSIDELKAILEAE